MSSDITIVDRGRGAQLSNCRITVQDLVPYLQQGCTPEQIKERMPVLTTEGIRVIERYVQENFDAVMEEDRHIRERNALRAKPEEVLEAEHAARLVRLDDARRLILEQKQRRNGNHSASG